MYVVLYFVFDQGKVTYQITLVTREREFTFILDPFLLYHFPCSDFLSQEETVVRDKGIECLAVLCSVDGISLTDDIMPVLHKLAAAEW